MSLLSRSVNVFEDQRLDGDSGEVFALRVDVIHHQDEREREDDGRDNRE